MHPCSMKQTVDQATRHKAAITVMVNKYHTSKLDIYGELLIHPLEHWCAMIKEQQCNSVEHGQHVEGCWCHYKEKDCCNRKTNFKYQCRNSTRTVLQHNLCYHNHDLYRHCTWNHNGVAAINIGRQFIANAMGLILGSWASGIQ